MKKNVLGLLAVVAAVSLSAFTTRSKTSTDDLFYWFRQSDQQFVGSSSSPDNNPLGCNANGDNCVKGYQRSQQPISEPSGPADAERALNP